MCGIVGYVGNKDAVSVLTHGLSKLEYRGYDSAGVAVYSKDSINIVKTKGRLAVLEERIAENPISGNLGIGHTRWATHGAPSDQNSHPHLSYKNKFAVVHNGIIENYMHLKEELLKEGYEFVSETDTETAAHLIDFYYKSGLGFKEAVFKALERVEGSYAMAVMCEDFKDTLIAARKDCPLIVGLSENENFIASDVTAILNYTRDVYFLGEMEVAVVKKDSIEIFDKNKNKISKEVSRIDWDIEAAEKGGYEYFMLKEINEQAKIVKDTLAPRLKDEFIELDGINIGKKLKDINKIYMVACGTAFYASQIGKALIEKFCRIPVIAEVASEFRYNDPLIDENSLVILVSQSGETADTLAALRLAKAKSARVLAVVNAVGSTIAREADDVLYTHAGPEIAVASTKAFSAQIAAMYLVAIHFGMELSKISLNEYKEYKKELEKLPSLIDNVLTKSHIIEELAKKYLSVKNVFYIGRGLDYIISFEGSLKLKEIAYIHSEAYAAGELKHGPIALIEDSTLVVGNVTVEHLLEKTISNLKECKARGASVLAIAMEGCDLLENASDDVFFIPRVKSDFAPLLANIPQQVFAYYMAHLLGNDVDKPRNLAKSVTVE